MYTTLALAQLQSLEITAAAFMVDLVQLMGGNLSDMATRLLADGLRPGPAMSVQGQRCGLAGVVAGQLQQSGPGQLH